MQKSGVYAVRAGPVLAENIDRALKGKPLRPYQTQREALYLVTTGRDEGQISKGVVLQDLQEGQGGAPKLRVTSKCLLLLCSNGFGLAHEGIVQEMSSRLRPPTPSYRRR